MGTVVDATIQPDQFALRETFDEMPQAEFEAVQIVSKGEGYVLPFVWARAPDLEELDRVLREDSTTEDVSRLVCQDERCLYQVEWHSRVRLVISLIGTENGRLLDAQATDGRWKFRILFPSHDSVSSTFESCRDHDIDLSIRRVKGVVETLDRSGNELTDKQYEALAAGIQSNYYEVPRGQSLKNLANDLDISHQALSERLRRGHRRLIEQMLQ